MPLLPENKDLITTQANALRQNGKKGAVTPASTSGFFSVLRKKDPTRAKPDESAAPPKEGGAAAVSVLGGSWTI